MLDYDMPKSKIFKILFCNLRFQADSRVECLFCEDLYHHPDQHQEFLQHLLSEHNFVIGDVKLVANFPAYIRYWRNKFRTNSPDQFCTAMRAPVKSGKYVHIFVHCNEMHRVKFILQGVLKKLLQANCILCVL